MVTIFADFLITVDTLGHFLMSLVFVASLSKMVWLAAALTAKVVLAFSASYTVQTHVDSRLVRNLIAIFIYNFQVNLTLQYFHKIATRTFPKQRISL